MRRSKVSIIGGAGNVGSTCGLMIAQKGYADIVLQDMRGNQARARALDITQALSSLSLSSWKTDISVIGTDDYAAIEGSDIVVVTAGRARRPGESREDMLSFAMRIMVGDDKNPGVIPQIVRYAPNSKILMVSNPMDAMTYVAYRVSGFEKNRVFGQGGVLDSLRFRTFVAEALGVAVSTVNGGLVIGSHGDTMVPLTRLCSFWASPLHTLLSGEAIRQIVERTRNGGAEMVRLMEGTGGAYVAPAVAVEEMVQAVLLNTYEVLPCSVYLEGEYGIEGICLGVPVKLNRDGVYEIFTLPLNSEEMEALRRSAESVREVIALTGL